MAKQKKKTTKFLAKQKKHPNKPKFTKKKNTKVNQVVKKHEQQPMKKQQVEDSSDDENNEMDIQEFLNADISDEDELAVETDMAVEDDISDLSDDELIDDDLKDDDLAENDDVAENGKEDLAEDQDSVKLKADDQMDGDTKTVLTMELMAEFEKKAYRQHSVKYLRRLISVLADVSRIGDDDKGNKYSIVHTRVHNRVMTSILKNAYGCFEHHLKMEEGKSDVTKCEHWGKVRAGVRQLFSAIINMLQQVTDKTVVKFVLGQLGHYIKWLNAFPKMAKRLLVVLLNKWSCLSGGNSEEDDICMLAFMRIRDMALAMPFPFVERCLKGLYLAYYRHTKFTNETFLRAHTLMGNCVVELYGLDLNSSYQHAFVYIRQLALSLRRAIVDKTKDSIKGILNWQFVNALKVWTAVVCAYPKTEASNGLSALVYPLVQILMGMIRLVPTARYFPLRIHCIALLQQLAVCTNTFIPTSPVLLEILQSNDLRKRTKGESSGRPLVLDVTLTLSKSALDMQSTQDLIVSKTISLLTMEMDIYKFNIGYPEFTLPIVLGLKSFTSSCKVVRWTTMIKGLLASTQKRSEYIVSKRSTIDFSPQQIEKMEMFLQSDAKDAKARYLQILQDRQASTAPSKPSVVPKKKQAVLPPSTAIPKLEQPVSTAPMEVGDLDAEDIVQDMSWSSEDDS